MERLNDELLIRASGPASGLLLAWKVAQNAVKSASGVASEAARILHFLRAAGLNTPLACTRKTGPGGRALAARGVWAGGAMMHRLGLSETLLVFPKHRLLIASAELAARLAALRQRLLDKGLRPLIAPAGGVTAANALDCARAGADLLVSSAPYFAPPADVKVVFEADRP